MDNFSYDVYLDILGCSIKIQCKHDSCAKEIVKYLEPLVTEASSFTPDVIIVCEWTEATRHLFRSREIKGPQVLEGIQFLSPGFDDFQSWVSPLPPIPPFPLYPIRNRFVGLHASAVEKDNYATVFIGDKGAGKSTISVHMMHGKKGYSFITDETALVHIRTNIIEPFPRAIHTWKDKGNGLEKITESASTLVGKIRRSPAFISRIIFLEPCRNTQVNIKKGLYRLSAIESAQKLMLHHLDTGTDFHESITTLMKLSHTIPAEKYTYETYDELLDLINLIP